MDNTETKTSAETHEVTRLLHDFNNGRREALDAVIPIVYKELRKLAAHYLKSERTGHTLQPTALVHEAFLRLVGQEIQMQNRGHFFALSAKMMRQILVDYARNRAAAKRGGAAEKFSLEEAYTFVHEKPSQMISLDEALKELAQIDARRAQVVELRFFGGLNNEEIARVLGVHSNTVLRDWNLARAWLKKQLE